VYQPIDIPVDRTYQQQGAICSYPVGAHLCCRPFYGMGAVSYGVLAGAFVPDGETACRIRSADDPMPVGHLIPG
jgi:hypothetical protein